MGAAAVPLISTGAGFALNKLGGDKPSTTQVNPNTPQATAVADAASPFLQALFRGGASPFAGMTSDLQRGATNSLMQFLNANPEQQAFDSLQPGLLDIFAGGAAEGIGQAALPVVQRELQRSLGGLSNAAPGRFSTAFAGQGIDLASRAAQDFALLQSQARMQELQSRLGAGTLLGTLAGQAGSGAFGRALGAGQLGLAQTQAQIDPMLALLLGGLQFASPAPLDTVVGRNPLDTAGQLGGLAATFDWSKLLGGGGGTFMPSDWTGGT